MPPSFRVVRPTARAIVTTKKRGPGDWLYSIESTSKRRLRGFPVRNTLCRKSRAINVSGYNTIKVVSNGARHSYYLNGALVCTVNDNTWVDGNVMLFGGPANLATYGLKFDSVSIQAVGSNAPPAGSGGGLAINDPAQVTSPQAEATSTSMASSQ